MISPIFQNINKLDSNIRSKYNTIFHFNENSRTDQYSLDVDNGKISMKIFLNEVPSHVLESNAPIKWEYLTDTNDIRSKRITRVSYINNIVNDISDIFENKRFSNEYLTSLENEIINEGKESEQIDEDIILSNDGNTLYVNKDKLIKLFDTKSVVLSDIILEPLKSEKFEEGILGYEIHGNLSSNTGSISPASLLDLETTLNNIGFETYINTNNNQVTLRLECDDDSCEVILK